MALDDWMGEEGWSEYRARPPGDPPAENPGLYPDPEDTCSRPADLDDATLAQMDARAEADAAIEAAGVARGIAAGFGFGYAHMPGMGPLPGTHSGPAAGFGQGMVLDEAPATTVLALMADQATGNDPAGSDTDGASQDSRSFTAVSDDELMGLLSARGRIESRQAWEQLMTVAEFIRRRPAPGCPPEGPERMPRCWSEHAASELGLQLHLPPGAVDAICELATDLVVKLPLTSAALRDGIITSRKAEIIAGACSPLSPQDARTAEAAVFPDAATLTPRALGDRIKAAAIAADPDAATSRREEAAKTRRVEVCGEDSGNAAIHGRELPPAAVLAANENLNARARQLKASGIRGSMDDLRCIAYMEAFGVTIDPLTPSDDDPAGQDDTPAGKADGDADGTDAGHHATGSPADSTSGSDGGDVQEDDTDGGTDGGNGGRSPAGPRPAGHGGAAATSPLPAGFAGHVNLTIPMPTLLGLAERPGTASRIGTIDPALARDLAAAAARSPASTWCITVTGADGRPVAHGCARPAKTRKPPKGAKAPPGPATRHGLTFIPDDGPPDDHHGPPDGRHGRWRLNLAALTGSPSGQEMIIDLEPLDGSCDHKHQAVGHDPGIKLRHLTGVLNSTCTFPPCRRPEAQSDYEHSRPHDQGGMTCLCEGGPVCRHNHIDKQQPGWKLRHAGNRGWFKWTTPSGRSYLSRPTQYPD